MHPAIVSQFIKDNPGTPQPAPADIAVTFFQKFSQDHPGKFLSVVTDTGNGGSTVNKITPVDVGSDIQSIFFDMWRLDHPSAALQNVPGDMVTTSGSGLDPHITLQNAELQLDRVTEKWAANLKRDTATVRTEIEVILQKNAFAPLGGLLGEKIVNVLPTACGGLRYSLR
jgi:potassium-transporting ATPase KdpC subunit